MSNCHNCGTLMADTWCVECSDCINFYNIVGYLPDFDPKRRSFVEKKYGLSLGDYHSLLKRQSGDCAICHMRPEGRILNIDHDHTTGKVRGLLCNNCNTALGLMHDDLEAIDRMYEYIKHTRENLI